MAHGARAACAGQEGGRVGVGVAASWVCDSSWVLLSSLIDGGWKAAHCTHIHWPAANYVRPHLISVHNPCPQHLHPTHLHVFTQSTSPARLDLPGPIECLTPNILTRRL
jgi:hypothetical protein